MWQCCDSSGLQQADIQRQFAQPHARRRKNRIGQRRRDRRIGWLAQPRHRIIRGEEGDLDRVVGIVQRRVVFDHLMLGERTKKLRDLLRTAAPYAQPVPLLQPVVTETTADQASTAGQQNVHGMFLM